MTDRPLDSHVRVYLKAVTPSDRKFWTCPKCDQEMQRRLRPRDSSGRLKDHCGCRNFKPADPVPIHMRPANRERRIKARRLQRQQIAAAEGREVRVWRYFDAHVKAWKAYHWELKEAARKLRGPVVRVWDEKQKEQNRRYTAELSDGYISRRLRKGMAALKGVKLPKALIDLERMRLLIVREVRRSDK